VRDDKSQEVRGQGGSSIRRIIYPRLSEANSGLIRSPGRRPTRTRGVLGKEKKFVEDEEIVGRRVLCEP
jgi:hypothetical protein